MKIIIINAVYGIKSTGRTYQELQDYLQRRGHECIVVYGNQKGDYPNTYFMGNSLDYHLHALLGRLTGYTECFSSHSTRKLLSFLDSYKPDIVHLGNLHSNFINIPMLLEYLARRDIVTTVTLHDCFFFTGGCMYYTTHQCDKWETRCGHCPYFRNQRSWFFDRTARLHAKKISGFQGIPRLGVIGVSQWITGEAKKSPVFAKAQSIITIYNWIDVDKFHPCGDQIKTKLGIRGKKMILSVASTWLLTKGIREFISLAELLPEDMVIVLVGKQENDITFPKNIISISETDNIQELAAYYSAADVFVQLSLEETFGKVVAEALACGTPAVVYNSTAAPELIHQGQGEVVEVSQGLPGILAAIKRICQQPKSLDPQHALTCFSKEASCAAFVEYWERLSQRSDSIASLSRPAVAGSC